MSLVHVGSSDSFAITTEGRQAATLLYEALEATDPAVMRDKARQSSAIYDQIVPRENYGGEYTTLQWFDDYLAADENDRPNFLTDPQVSFFFQQFSADNYKLLKEYMNRKYRLHDIGDEETQERPGSQGLAGRHDPVREPEASGLGEYERTAAAAENPSRDEDRRRRQRPRLLLVQVCQARSGRRAMSTPSTWWNSTCAGSSRPRSPWA